MNNTFNLHRFGLLLKRQWLEFGKIYLIILGVALGIIIAFYGIGLYKPLFEDGRFSANDVGFREPLFLALGFLFISIIASSYYAHLGQKPKAIIDLLIPASTFEKFLSGLFFTAILSTASFLLLFYLADLAFIAKVKSVFESSPRSDKLQYIFDKNWKHAFMPIFAVPFFITSIFLLGSVYFNRFHYIKTAICVMIFSGIWTYVTVQAADALFEGRIPVETTQNMNFTQRDGELLALSLIVLLTLIFWSITYVRLKEKEV